MPENVHYIPVMPVRGDWRPFDERRGSLAGRAGLVLSLAALLLMALGALVAWRWLDANLLHWGIDDAKTVEVNSADLLQRVQAFELVTVKHTYDSKAQVDVSKVFNAGPASVSLPSWMAGQKMAVEGKVTVTAGTDLSKVTPDEITMTREGNEVRVLLSLPPPEVTATELVPSTLDLDTSQGVLTRLKTRLGGNEKDLRDQAFDRLAFVAKESAVKNGLLTEAAHETELRLGAFLNAFPQTGSAHVTYVVQARLPTID